jgi:riboflavin kinase/FMN adenylyltransferase
VTNARGLASGNGQQTGKHPTPCRTLSGRPHRAAILIPVEILSEPVPLNPNGVCLALGMFDGVHLGHQHVVRQALLDARALGARSVVATFDPHPLAVVRPEKAPRLLQPLSQRLDEISRLGAEAALVLRFDAEFSRRTGEQFVRGLAGGFGRLRSFTVGAGFQFGHGRSGNVPLLRTLGREFGFGVNAMAPIHIGAEVVSSTRVRAELREGRLGHVAELLGRPYSISGPVVAGDRIGRTLGFPTANLDVTGLELPPTGVYAARVRHPGGEHPAALNLGFRPTLGSPEPQLRFEVHLIGFEGDLYGSTVSVEFVRQLRAERRFPGLDALKAQIARDVAAAAELLR